MSSTLLRMPKRIALLAENNSVKRGIALLPFGNKYGVLKKRFLLYINNV